MFNSGKSLFSSNISNNKFQSVDNIEPIKREQQYGFNGRIFIDPFTKVKPYDLYTDSAKPQDTNVNIISNIVVPNALSRSYFSNDNVDNLQKQIINEVYRISQKTISRQSYQELQIIMKSMYLQYGRNIPTNIEEQVITLNKYVVDECVKIIIPNVLQYNKYIDDISSPIPIMPRSQNVSNKGSKWGDLSSLIPQ